MGHIVATYITTHTLWATYTHKNYTHIVGHVHTHYLHTYCGPHCGHLQKYTHCGPPTHIKTTHTLWATCSWQPGQPTDTKRRNAPRCGKPEWWDARSVDACSKPEWWGTWSNTYRANQSGGTPGQWMHALVGQRHVPGQWMYALVGQRHVPGVCPLCLRHVQEGCGLQSCVF